MNVLISHNQTSQLATNISTFRFKPKPLATNIHTFWVSIGVWIRSLSEEYELLVAMGLVVAEVEEGDGHEQERGDL